MASWDCLCDDEGCDAGVMLAAALGYSDAEYSETVGRTGVLNKQDVADALDVLLALSSRDRVKRLVMGHPELLIMGFELPAWLDFLTSYGIRKGDFFRLLSSNTALFTRSSVYNAGLVIQYLTQLGLTQRDIAASIVPRCASLLSLDPQRQLAPVVALMAAELGVNLQEQVVHLIAKCPVLLTLSVDQQLRPRVEYLRSLGLSNAEVSAVAVDVPSLLTSDPEPQVAPALRFLSLQCGLGRTGALRVAAACPSVFCLSAGNLAAKWCFLSSQMGCGPTELSAYPPALGTSLLNETGPRFVFAAQKGQLHRFEAAAAADAGVLAAGGGGGRGAAADGGAQHAGGAAGESRLAAGEAQAGGAAGGEGGSAATAVACEPSDSALPHHRNGGGKSGSSSSSSGSSVGSGGRTPGTVLDLGRLLDSSIHEYLGVVGGDDDEFQAARFAWQVSDGRSWSGMVTVFDPANNGGVGGVGRATGSW
ncbi:hypothetical protein FOA52_014221 [Chlamydomonas sp. UWO 241]|nr:hypothetical protein FOA52_014221 [Chlamydomonas sp. UWO 241]